MGNRIFNSLWLCGAFFTTEAMATILPPNNLHLEDSPSRLANITEEQFNELIAEATEPYKEIVASHGGNLIVRKDWNNPEVNAAADRKGDDWILMFFGGLVRRPEITADGFTLVICHELGHELAGFPFYGRLVWAATEGQSDYFGTQSCLRKLWRDQDEKNVLAAETIPEEPKALCDEAWSTPQDQALCYRSMMAGYALGNLLAYVDRSGEVSFTTPDTNEVRKTYEGHPKAQCRLDTYMAGALCPTEFDTSIIPEDEEAAYRFSCDAEHPAQRPRCWFKPGE